MAGCDQKDKCDKDEKKKESVCRALTHPVRLRILEVLHDGPRSPSQFVEEGLVPRENFKNYEQALSLASYHFRELEKEGCIEIIESIPRRGAMEHVYKSLASVYFNDEEFDALPETIRARLSRVSMQSLVARAERAIHEGTFDARPDRHLTWMPMQLDESGWDEAMEALATCFGRMTEIKHDARDRLAGSGDPVIPTTVGMLGFETPPPPPLPGAADRTEGQPPS